MEQLFLSIVIPLYNPVESDFIRCIDSLKDLNVPYEVLLIDDGTDKDKIKQCELYVQDQSYCRFIHQKNQGVSKARNTGIKESVGKYIYFVDIDDYVSKDFITYINNNFNSLNNDWILFDVKEYHALDHKTVYRRLFDKESHNLHTTDILPWHVKTKMLNECWGKLIKRDMILENNILFPSGILEGEDKYFNTLIMEHADTFSYVPLCSYIYNIMPRKNYRITNNPYQYFDNFFFIEDKKYELLKKLNMSNFVYDYKNMCIELMTQDCLLLKGENKLDYKLKQYIINNINQRYILKDMAVKHCKGIKLKIYYLILKYRLWFLLDLILMIKKLI